MSLGAGAIGFWGIFRAVSQTPQAIGRRRKLSVVLIGLLPIAVRLAQLPWQPPPQPAQHDEFSYLLAGDTFASGRLTNPSHPLWIHFETFHVIQKPSYSSKYPPAQGMVLAFGKVLTGQPWAGVLLSVGVMCACFCWMLQGWVPPPWALAGGALGAAKFSIHHYWIDSYWGGAPAAIGGALVLGSLPRIRRGEKAGAFWLGCGIAILAISRPYEGLLLSAPVSAAGLIWSLRRHRLVRTLTILCAVLAPFTLWNLLFNWRVTGNPLRQPYAVHEAAYSQVPLFLWQALPPSPQYHNPEIRKFMTKQVLDFWRQHEPDNRVRRILEMLEVPGSLHLREELREQSALQWSPLNVLVLVTLPWLARRRRLRLPLFCFGLVICGMMATTWYFEHYSAPIAGLRLLLWVEALRRLSAWKPFGARFLSWTAAAVVPASAAVMLIYLVRTPGRILPIHGIELDRPRIVHELSGQPGRHLVLVKYGANHDTNVEWVYNGADIDGSRIVWARYIEGMDHGALIHYFHDRRVWILEPDSAWLHPNPY